MAPIYEGGHVEEERACKHISAVVLSPRTQAGIYRGTQVAREGRGRLHNQHVNFREEALPYFVTNSLQCNQDIVLHHLKGTQE